MRLFPRPLPSHVQAAVETGVDAAQIAQSPIEERNSPARRFYAGRNLARARTIEDLRAMAHRRLPAFALEYLEGGAEDEATLARNLSAYARYRLLPKALVDVSHRDQSVALFERSMPLPFAIAPTGLNGLFWRKADVLLARAAAEAGIPFIQSSMSNDPIEDVAAVPDLRHWWQLYVFGEPSIREALIARAERAQCEALVLTIDAQFYGDREWEQRRFAHPGRLTLASILECALHPQWAATTLSGGMPSFANLVDLLPKAHRRFFDGAFWIRAHMDHRLDWKEAARLRKLWPRRFLIKGLLDPADAEKAAAIGADGVILSNHGGRQLDWTVSGLDVLPDVRRRIGNRLTVIVDGGVRRGTDILKAFALGADAVLVGRAPLYGLSAGGRKGVTRAIDILRDEIDLDLGLLGARSINELGPQFLAR
ncbi:alpha-hydroxy-acid oxidizing protein [Methylocystis parvus]|uniref:Alpha-hydroxy-acid oxidizing protein n=1 Tax=Methylocystis parvus TaxID=134 RepID=A0A6B8M3U6_9HYPH|nr:alpha-hydroxy-acid oxidizing protein [Methylocystis parvus]